MSRGAGGRVSGGAELRANDLHAAEVHCQRGNRGQRDNHQEGVDQAESGSAICFLHCISPVCVEKNNAPICLSWPTNRMSLEAFPSLFTSSCSNLSSQVRQITKM